MSSKILEEAIERQKSEMEELVQEIADNAEQKSSVHDTELITMKDSSLTYAQLREENQKLQKLQEGLRSEVTLSKWRHIKFEGECQSKISRLRELLLEYEAREQDKVTPIVHLRGLHQRIDKELASFSSKTSTLLSQREQELARSFTLTLEKLAHKIEEEKLRDPKSEIFVWHRHLARSKGEIEFYKSAAEAEITAIDTLEQRLSGLRLHVDELEGYRLSLASGRSRLAGKQRLAQRETLLGEEANAVFEQIKEEERRRTNAPSAKVTRPAAPRTTREKTERDLAFSKWREPADGAVEDAPPPAPKQPLSAPNMLQLKREIAVMRRDLDAIRRTVQKARAEHLQIIRERRGVEDILRECLRDTRKQITAVGGVSGSYAPQPVHATGISSGLGVSVRAKLVARLSDSVALSEVLRQDWDYVGPTDFSPQRRAQGGARAGIPPELPGGARQ